MAKKTFTNETLSVLVNKTKNYASNLVSTKADIEHSHEINDISNLQTLLDGKASYTHTHTASEIGASTSEHNHDSEYSPINHNHDENYSAINHTHSDYATIDSVDELSSVISDKANAVDLNSHASDTEIHISESEREYWNAKSDFSGSYNDLTNKPSIPSIDGLATEDYVDNKVGAITVESIGALPNTTVIPTVPTNVSAFTNDAGYLTEHQSLDGLATETYVNTQIDAIDIPSTLSDLTTDSTHRVVTDAEKANWNAKSDFSGSYNDLTDKPTIPSISGLATETYVDEAVSTKADSNHNHNSIYYTETEIDTLLEGKANSSHTHTISNITNLQSTLDGKANASHGTHVSYSTTAPVMDGSASVGTASTVARSDHKHPTDTSRAAQTSLDSHTSNKSNPHGVTLAQLGVTATVAELNKMDGVTATTAELNILDGVTATTTEINYVDGVTSNIQTQLNAKASSSHTHGNATTSASGLMSAGDKSKLDGIASGANKYTLPTASSSTLGGVKTTSTVTSNSGYTACPIIDGVPYYKDTNTTYNLGSFGVTATAAELNALDGITATVTELNYVDGVTSNIQTQLNGKAASSHTHNYAGSSSAGGAATSANKLATARTISLTGDVTGSTSFDGSGNVSITTTVADDSHNHTIANVDGLQSALDGKSATSHTHTAEALVAMAEALFGTNYQGGVEYSYGSGSGKNILTEISNMPQGFHTIYAIAGTTGNPETAESYRYFIHKTSTTIGWIWAFGADGSIYSNYLAGANTYKGWKTIHDAKRKPLWTGSYYMTAGHTATPSKKLSQCEHGWMLLWSDYDPDTSTVNNTDFCTTMIPNRNWAGSTWNGAAYYCDIPRYTAGTATDSESRVIKVLNVYDNKLVGTANNNAAPRNDVILRAIYEF